MEVSEAMRCVEDGESGTIGITLAAEVKRLQRENKWLHSGLGDCATSFENGKEEAKGEWLSLEKQYSESLGRMAQLSDLTCGWILKMMGEQPTVLAGIPPEVVDAAHEIMEYVEAVRP